MKLAKNFHKAGSFLLAAFSTVVLLAESIFHVLPPELMGEYGAPIGAIITALITIERMRKQKNVSGDD